MLGFDAFSTPTGYGDRRSYEREVVGRHRFPRQVLLISVVGPFLLEYMLHPRASLDLYLMGVASNAVLFVGITGACYGFARFGLPRVFERVHRGLSRLVFVAASAAVLSGATGFLLAPVHNLFCPDDPPSLPRFLTICMIVGTTLGLPALLGMHLRARLLYESEVRQKEQRARVEAQLHELQARTNPHFLFNALNTVASLIPEDPELAERTVERLASMFRYSLENARSPLVPVSDELDIVTDYLEVQRARFGRRFDFLVEATDEARRGLIPPMSLQPLVENAVLHGASRRARGGQIHVHVELASGRLVCTVRDNGADAKAEAHGAGSHTSLADLQHRLRLVYGDEGALEATPAPGGGFHARLSVPFTAEAA